VGKKPDDPRKVVRKLMKAVFPSPAKGLELVPADHVVYKSFYLLDKPYGRLAISPLSALITAPSAFFIAVALGPTGSGLKTEAADGTPRKPAPNSTAPSVVLDGSVSISRSMPWTRSLLASVIAIEPESSTIASMLVFGVQVAAAAPGARGPARANNELAAVALINARFQLRFFI